MEPNIAQLHGDGEVEIFFGGEVIVEGFWASFEVIELQIHHGNEGGIVEISSNKRNSNANECALFVDVVGMDGRAAAGKLVLGIGVGHTQAYGPLHLFSTGLSCI